MAVDKLTGIKIKNNDGTYSAEIPISVQLENVIGAGTAAAKDVPASGNASTSQVVMGNDTRLTNARPASDVYAWAKASTKPSYTATEVGAIASTLKGAASGVAELDSAGKVPSSQLPSYVDDVLEYNAKSSFPSTGETGKIYVDKSTNLTYRWSGTAYVEISPSLALGTTSSTAFRGDYGNTAYSHATNKGSAYTSGMYKITTNSEGHVTAATAIQKSDITGLGIPGQDTTYSDATTSVHGLMSTSDKTKLNGIATGAEVNQNAFSNVKVGSTTIEADSKTDTLELAAGSNITLTPDATGDKVTIAATDTTYSDATTSVHGLMSTSDKTKLNGIASGAEVNQNAFSNVKVGSTTIAADGKTDTLELAAGSNITLTPDASRDKVTIAATDTTYSAATTSAAGLMSAADKTKLNGIAAGAQVNAVTSVAGKTGAVTLAKGDVGLGNVDNTSDATKKSNFTGSVASGNTGFVTGGDVYDAITSSGVSSVNNKTGAVVLTKSDLELGNVGNFKAVSTVASQGLSDTEKANARANIGAGTSSFNGAYSSLSGKPTLGTAAAKDVAASGNASSTQVVMGNDTRLTDSRPASDVSSWAKASSKPSYNFNEIGAGNITVGDGANKISLRNHEGYRTGIYYSTPGNEATVFANKNSVTSWIFATTDPDSRTSWNGLTNAPALQIRNNRVSINKLYNAVDIDYTLDVNGTFHASGDAALTSINGVTVGSSPKFTDTTYSTATTSAAGLMSSTDKSKLNGIASGAEVNQNAFSNVKVGSTTVAADGKTDTLELVAGSNITLTPDATNDKVTIAATDTTYSDATTSAHGLMSTSDKTKLNGIATGAQVNQNAFSNIKVGSTTVAADSKTDTLELAGSNVTLTPDATNDKVTIGITKANVTSALGYTPPTSNTWRGIQNNLTSDSTSDSLSAAQGKALANGSARDNTKVNPNLLDNWYFVGGGSQQGGGQFPINQRGKTSYSVSNQFIYTIDRWLLSPSSRAAVQLQSGGMSIYMLDQFTDAILPSGIYTGSVLLSDGRLFYGHNQSYTTGNACVLIRDNGVVDMYILGDTGSGNHPRVRIESKSGGALSIRAVKLEVGDHQTLAHQDNNGNWVLNEIPNYQQELAKCQRYQAVYYADSSHLAPLGLGYSNSAGDNICLDLATPVPLRAVPTVSGDFPYFIQTNRDSYPSSTSGWCSGISGSNARVNFSTTTCDSFKIFGGYIAGGKRMILDANL